LPGSFSAGTFRGMLCCLAALPELPSKLPLAALARPSAMCTDGAGERRSGGTLAAMDGAGDRRRARLPLADAAGERCRRGTLRALPRDAAGLAAQEVVSTVRSSA
jgi:hypothetical protein